VLTSVLLPFLGRSRVAAGLSQVDLARRAGLMPESICRFEKQRRCAGIGATRRLAQALQVSVATLTGGVEFGERRAVRRAHEPPEVRRVRELPSERTCADCGETKALEMFQRIKAHEKRLLRPVSCLQSEASQAAVLGRSEGAIGPGSARPT
jgi:transcriptional regulator with XRE-family HTH domain